MWTKLRKDLRRILREGADVHLSVWRMKSQRGCTDLPRYTLTLNGETVWSYPDNQPDEVKQEYPYVDHISQLLRDYLNCPKEELRTKVWEEDIAGLVPVLRTLDRRVSNKVKK